MSMSRKTRRIIRLSLIGVIFAAVVVSVVLIAVEIGRNPLLGLWNEKDSVGSYEFYEDGKVEVEFQNEKLPVLKTKYNGTLDGTYAYDKMKKEVSITLNVYSKEITTHYTYTIEDNVLTLTDSGTEKSRTYVLYEPTEK